MTELDARRYPLIARYLATELRVPKGQPTGGQWTNGGALAGAIDRVEGEIVGNRTGETLVILDSNGKEILRKSQDGPAVDMTDAEIALLKDKVTIHNHPLGWGSPIGDPRRLGNSFSPPDMALALHGDVAEMRAVSPGYEFSAVRPLGGWPKFSTFARTYERLDGELRDEWFGRIALPSSDDGWGLTSSERQAHAEADHYHELNTRLARELGFQYTRTPRDPGFN